MNKLRRQLLRGVVQVMEMLKGAENNEELLDTLKQAANDLEMAYDEEQEVYDNLPENLAWSIKADILTDNLDNLTDAISDMEVVVDTYEAGEDKPYSAVKKEINSVIKNCTEAIERA